MRSAWRSVQDETAYYYWREHGVCCCVRPLYRVVPYTDKHIVGISGRVGGMVDQLTLHYSDGTTKIKGGPGGQPVPPQMFDPAVDGHIIQVEWDEMPHYLGGGFRFHLSGGKVITVDGNACRWRQGDLKMTRSCLLERTASATESRGWANRCLRATWPDVGDNSWA